MVRTKEEVRLYNKRYHEEHKEEAREKGKKYYQEHKEERSLYLKAWRERNPDARRKNDIRKYGITLEDYDDLFSAQGGVCAICGKPETSMQYGKVVCLSVDHNHTTGKIRGLLCNKCNFGIGYMNDDPTVLQAAATYLLANS